MLNLKYLLQYDYAICAYRWKKLLRVHYATTVRYIDELVFGLKMFRKKSSLICYDRGDVGETLKYGVVNYVFANLECAFIPQIQSKIKGSDWHALVCHRNKSMELCSGSFP